MVNFEIPVDIPAVEDNKTLSPSPSKISLANKQLNIRIIQEDDLKVFEKGKESMIF